MEAHAMAFENTITEVDLTGQTQIQIQGLDDLDREPDLAVEGMSESLLSVVLNLFRKDR